MTWILWIHGKGRANRRGKDEACCATRLHPNPVCCSTAPAKRRTAQGRRSLQHGLSDCVGLINVRVQQASRGSRRASARSCQMMGPVPCFCCTQPFKLTLMMIRICLYIRILFGACKNSDPGQVKRRGHPEDEDPRETETQRCRRMNMDSIKGIPTPADASRGKQGVTVLRDVGSGAEPACPIISQSCNTGLYEYRAGVPSTRPSPGLSHSRPAD